jgi:glutamyl-tRNA reductase
VAPEEVVSALYVHRGDQVAHRLAATAAGLHSLVLGETQIQGQVRRALELALTAGTAGPELRRMFESAIAAGRRVRSRTAIGQGAASVPSAGVDLARRRLGGLGRSTVVLIGTGNTAELAAKQLVDRGAKRLLVAGRDPAGAERLAGAHGGHAIALDRLAEAVAQADVVIAATGASRPILRSHHLGPAPRPMLVIDLSVPRNVAPEVAALTGVEVHTVDDLYSITERALEQRRAQIPEAYAILGDEVARFTGWLGRRQAAA